MKDRLLIIVLLIVGAVISNNLNAQPSLKLEHGMDATSDEIANIKQHIANLKKIDQPDFGLSSTMGDTAFAPVPGSEGNGGGFILTNHRIKTTDDVRALVEYGPKALPFLLEALDDKTPTELVMSRKNSIFTVMYFSNELEGNPNNILEQKAIKALPEKDWDGQTTMEDYRVKVGDVCFAIIGQIVGRQYRAVRYQPSAIVIINSPVHDAELAKQVRFIWTTTNAAQTLFSSLMFDYSTNRTSNGDIFSGRGMTLNLPAKAAMRLLYYFPQDSAEMIAKRLAKLDVTGQEGNFTNWQNREKSNGVVTEDFIKAVAWSPVPVIRREVLNIFKRTTDIKLLMAALPGLDSSETNLIQARLESFIVRLPAEERGPYGDGYNLLVGLGETLGEQAKPTFVRYIHDASLQRWRSMIKVLEVTQQQWAVELLSPALNDKREFGWDYALIPGQNEPRRKIRVCDEAAEAISLSRPDLKFQMAGEHSDLDRQIAEIQRRLSANTPQHPL